MKWWQLRNWIDEMPLPRQKDDISIYDEATGEFISLAASKGPLEVVEDNGIGDGVLDVGHRFLVIMEPTDD